MSITNLLQIAAPGLVTDAAAYGFTSTASVDVQQTSLVTAIAAAVASGVKTVVIREGNYQLAKYITLADLRGVKLLGLGRVTIKHPSADLNASTARTFTRSSGNILTAIDHRYYTGDGPYRATTSGTLPTGLATATDYWPIRIDADTYSLASSKANALAGTAITLSSNGTGTHTLSDRVGNSDQICRSAFLLTSNSDVEFENITFVGDLDTTALSNTGDGIYARHTVGLTVRNCNQIGGGALITQDAAIQTTGVGGSLSVTAGVVTLTNSSALFVPGHFERWITITGSPDPRNDGKFQILSVPSTTTVTYANADAQNDAGSTLFAWAIDDDDRITRIIGGHSLFTRQSIIAGNDVVIDGHTIERPDNNDAIGIGDAIAVTGSGTTSGVLRDFSDQIRPNLVGCYVLISGATTGANNGIFQITAVTLRSQFSRGSITYANPSAVAEAFTGTWYVPRGEKVGIGAGATGFVFSGGTVTFAASAPSFTSNDVGKNLRTINPTSAGNAGLFTIASFVDSTHVTFANASGVTEAFSGQWTIDSHDRNNTNGSSHGIYIFAGRSNYKITRCTFKNIRTTGVKISGSSLPISDISIDDNEFIECGAATVFGADDSQEHTGISFTNNRVRDCGTGRLGWNDASAVSVLGARNVTIADNKFHYSRIAFGVVDGRGISANIAIQAGRYVIGITQPCEDVTITGNKFTCDPAATTLDKIVLNGIKTYHVGQRAYHNTGGTLAKGHTFTAATSDVLTSSSHNLSTGDGPWQASSTGTLPGGMATSTNYYIIRIDDNTFKLSDTQAHAIAGTNIIDITSTGTGTHTLLTSRMTLTDNTGNLAFSPQMIGRSLELVNSASSNDITGVQIETVPTKNSFTYTNAGGTGGNVSAGTWRVFPGKYGAATTNLATAHTGGQLVVSDNTFDNVTSIAITSTGCVGPDIRGNTLSPGRIDLTGDVSPRVYGNRWVASNASTANIIINSGTSFPVLYDNTVTAPHALGISVACRDIGIGLNSSTIVDPPLLGKRGRARPSGGREQVLVSFGYNLVDGDNMFLQAASGTTYTYKASGPTGNQFNTIAGLLTLLNARTDVTAIDYGAQFSSGATTTTHILITRTAQSSSDAGGLFVRCAALYPTALVEIRNHTNGASVYTYGRGAGSPSAAGPIVDKTVLWSMQAALESAIKLDPDNGAARALMDGAKATGRIVCAAKADLVDGETFTIGDGVNPAKVYEFDVTPNGVTAGHVLVDVSGATTSADVAAIVRTAILANHPGIAVTSNYADIAVPIASVDISAFTPPAITGETFAFPGHGLITGDQVRLSSDGTLPAGLSTGTDYWIIAVSSGKVAFATSLANALAGTRINLTNTGSGGATTHTIHHGAITLTNNWIGAGGNVTITETVAHASFQVSGMKTGGSGSYRQLKNTDDAACCALMKHARNGDFAGNNYTTKDVVVSAVDFTTNETLTVTAHGFSTGDVVRVYSTTTLPAGLSLDTDYYVIYFDDDNIQLATSWANATAFTPTKINLTDAGTGTHTVRQQAIPEFRWSIT